MKNVKRIRRSLLAILCCASLLVGGIVIPQTAKASEVTPPIFPEITFSDFGVEDGTYSYNSGNLAVNKTVEGGFANKSFVGTVNFTSAAFTKIFFGGTNAAHGATLYTNADGSIAFCSSEDAGFDTVNINPTIDAKVIGKDVKIKLSIEVTNLDEDDLEDDVRFWLYFDGVLYDHDGDGTGAPIVEAIDYTKCLGNYFGIWSNNVESSVTVKSEEKLELTPPTFEEITFSNAGIKDGTYDADNSNTDRIGSGVDAKLNGGFANKTFIGMIHFPTPTNGEEWASVRIGGTAQSTGVMLQNNQVDGTLTLSHVPEAGKTAGFTASSLDKDTAKVESLTGRDVEVKLSFEVVDLDGDGEDDVRLWLYFDGILYGDTPVVEANDYLQHIGERISITTRSKLIEDTTYYSSISVKSKQWDDCIVLGDAQIGQVSIRVRNGDTLPTGYIEDKYIISWSDGTEEVTTYTTGGTYTPDYIDLNMLDIYTQNKVNSITGTTYDERFIGSIDAQTSRYTQVGFAVSKTNTNPTIGGTKCVYQSTTTVYRSLCETEDGKATYKSTEAVYGAGTSEYMYTLEIKNVPAGAHVYVRAYVVLDDWTVVYGTAKEITVDSE